MKRVVWVYLSHLQRMIFHSIESIALSVIARMQCAPRPSRSETPGSVAQPTIFVLWFEPGGGGFLLLYCPTNEPGMPEH
jgi:hypothetical protein